MSERLRAPSEDGALLAVPPLDQAPGLLAQNRAALASSRLTLLGKPLAQLRQEARRQSLAAADHYHWEQGEPVSDRADPNQPLLVSGHQPELFHPGVWVKNFALAGLARQTNGLALNLIVDSDTLKNTSIRVPVYSGGLRSIPFDRWTGETPWEERHLLEPETFAAFGPAVLAALEPWGYRPLLADLWEGMTRDVLVEKRLLGEAFCRARRRLERRWGVHNREVPLSRLWNLKPFAHFAGALLSELPRFQSVYNEAVRAYRQQHGIRSRSHPVPDLIEQDGWYEAPFWIWRQGQRRDRLMVRAEAGVLHLRLGREDGPTLPHPRTGEPFLRAWCGLGAQKIRVRSRALTTTLTARLLLADLFIHGLGGGLYDALTDELLRGFFDLEPPGFLILTGTRRLPLGLPPNAAQAHTAQARRVRDLHYNPQRHRDDPAGAALRAERQAWVERTPTTRAERRQRFHEIRRLSAELRQGLEEKIAQAEAELARREEEHQRATHWGRRDFSFVLFPEETLRSFFP